jgi:hypothetical protein
MTKEEILGMEVGNDLDILVAEKVFGWRKGTNEYNILGWQWSCQGGNPILDDGWDGVWVTPLSCTPNYSTDIKAAWEVFEKFGFQGSVTYSGSYYYCEIMNGWNKTGAIYGKAENCNSAPEAICKAALIAVMEEKAEVENDH